MKDGTVELLLKNGERRIGTLVRQSYDGIEIQYGDGTREEFKTSEMAGIRSAAGKGEGGE